MDLYNCNKISHIHIIRVPEAEEKEWSRRLLKETMSEDFMNLAKDIYLQIQKAKQIPHRINSGNLHQNTW